MTAQDLLSQLRAKGVEVSRSGDDRLVIDAPKGTITDELRKSLAAHKAELLEILRQPAMVEPEPEPPPVAESRTPLPVIEAPSPASEDGSIAASVAEEIAQL